MGYHCDCGNHYGRLSDLSRHTAKCKIRKRRSKLIEEVAESLRKADGREEARRILRRLESPAGISKQRTSKGRSKYAELASPSAVLSQPGPSKDSASSVQGGSVKDYYGPRLMKDDNKEFIEVPAMSQHDSVCLRDSQSSA